MDQQLIEKVMRQVSDELGIKTEECKAESAPAECASQNIGMTEFVGTAMGDTIGLVIASVDPMLKDVMNLGKFRSIGIIGARTGAGPQIWAVDEADAARAVNGCFDSMDVSDARRAVEIALQAVPKYFGDVYGNDAGHLEFQYTARASYCLEKALGAPVGRAFGMTCAGPAAIGTVLADVAVKAANVEVVGYTSPGAGSHSNEVILTFTGDSGAVRQAVKAAIEAGKKMLGALGDEPKSSTTPYI